MKPAVVSVVLPVFNGLPYLKETVASLQAQTFTDFEVVVIDDGSTDGTSEYLQAIDDRRFRTLRTERVGIAAALNFGIERTESELIARIDADDVAYPQRLERQMQWFRNHPRLVLLGCNYELIDIAGKVLEEWECMTSDLANRWLLLFSATFVHPGVVFRRTAFELAGGYNPQFAVAQDYDLWTRIANYGDIMNVPEKLLRKRAALNGWSTQRATLQRRTASEIAGRYATSLGLADSDETYAALYAFLAWGEINSSTSPEVIVEAFRRAIADFRLRASDNDRAELESSIRFFEQRMRWRCGDMFAQNLLPLRSAVKWIRLRSKCDPIGGGMFNTVLFKISKVLSRRGQEPCQVNRHVIS